MVPFAINGSETGGSITLPASRCGVTASRPAFGTVAQTGPFRISEAWCFPKVILLILLLSWMVH